MSGLLQRQEGVRVVIQLPPQINTNFHPALPGVLEALQAAPLEALRAVPLEALPELEVFLRKPCDSSPFTNKQTQLLISSFTYTKRFSIIPTKITLVNIFF